MAARLLVPGEVYTVTWAEVGQSRTHLALAGIDTHGQGFNSVLFDPADGPQTPPDTAATTGKE